MITVISFDALTKFLLGEEIDYLRENGFALVHDKAPFTVSPRKDHEREPVAIQIDPLTFRRYLKYLQIHKLCHQNFNRTAVT